MPIGMIKVWYTEIVDIAGSKNYRCNTDTNRMKGDLMFRCLERLAEGACALGDLAVVIATAPYGSSHHEITRRLDAAARQRDHAAAARLIPDRSFHNLLYRLRQDGLVAPPERKSTRFIKITAKGKRLFKQLIKQKARALPAHASYTKRNEQLLKIIVFDVPERERNKRPWLGVTLRHLGFERLQKSVFAGRAKLPESFIADLARLHLAPHVEIFAINKLGTLTHLPFSKRV